ncbi:MAG TPA: FG-GAP-like repeat-containing protein [Planctomycetota bacterium]|nr:FG-GAP-like repeat-containing protein [Planctomycetota bacterium]
MELKGFAPAALIGFIGLNAAMEACAQGGGGSGPVVYQVHGTRRSELGWSLVLVGDVDRDGSRDFAASSLEATAGENPGRVDVRSGRSGAVLRTWRFRDGRVMNGVVAAPDLDGDGGPELCVATEEEFQVLSPVTGKTWYSRPFASAFSGGRLLSVVVQDIDGDGIEDLVLGQGGADSTAGVGAAGRVSLHSGGSGARLWVREGTVERGRLGDPLIAAGDHDGDGAADLLTAGVLDDTAGRGVLRSSVHVLSLMTGVILQSFRPGEDEDAFGRAMASLGDRDGDGFPEVAIAAPLHGSPLNAEGEGGRTGWVGIFQGPGFHLLHKIEGQDPGTLFFHGSQLGHRLAAVGDLDRDGVPDLAVGTLLRDTLQFVTMGQLHLYSGSTWKPLTAYSAPQELLAEPFFETLSPLGDIDGDGWNEFLAAYPLENVKSSDGEIVAAGVIRALRFDPTAPKFLRGDTSGDGKLNLTDVILMAHEVAGALEGKPRSCPAAHDYDADGRIDVDDVLQLVRYLFLGREALQGDPLHPPAPPFPECGRYLRIDDRTGLPALPCDDEGVCAESEAQLR